jgi:hypothetical protein
VRTSNPKYCCLLSFFTINPTRTALGMKPNLHGQIPASNLSHFAVIYLTNICELLQAFESISALVLGDRVKSLWSSNFMAYNSMLRI